MRFPLYLKILLWFFLNLAVLGVAAVVFFAAQLRLGLDSLLSGRAGDRIVAVTEVLSHELVERSSRQQWPVVLERFSDAYGVDFFVFRENGEQIGGVESEFPDALRETIQAKGNPMGVPPRLRRRGPPGLARLPALAEQPGEKEDAIAVAAGQLAGDAAESLDGMLSEAPPPLKASDPLFLIRTENPTAYWAGVRTTIRSAERPPPHSGIVVLRTDSLLSGGLFFDVRPWVMVGVGVIVFCLLFWFPLVRGITVSIRQMTKATGGIAEGRFDTEVDDRRSDELGQLGTAINRMARRLEGFVTGQKRFLGDISHELCSPLARMQMALGVLEQKVSAADQAHLEDVREEVEQMSDMVAELLTFSKASLQDKAVNLETVLLRGIVDEVVRREGLGDEGIETEVDTDTRVMADARLLSRSLANLLRNAIKYAGTAGPITVSARRHGETVEVMVSDCGPGIPEEALEDVFDPFFRPEEARTRDTGGVGLGLAIVKTCVEACRGTVSCRNREPSGLEVKMRLGAG